MSDNQVTEPSETATPETDAESINYDADTPETKKFMYLIDDDEIDLRQVEAELSDKECERDHYKRERDQLRAENKLLAEAADRAEFYLAQERKQIATLTAALDKAREDSKRLDWLENNPQRIGWRITNGEPLFIFVRPGTGINRGTFRAAIDAAKGAK